MGGGVGVCWGERITSPAPRRGTAGLSLCLRSFAEPKRQNELKKTKQNTRFKNPKFAVLLLCLPSPLQTRVGVWSIGRGRSCRSHRPGGWGCPAENAPPRGAKNVPVLPNAPVPAELNKGQEENRVPELFLGTPRDGGGCGHRVLPERAEELGWSPGCGATRGGGGVSLPPPRRAGGPAASPLPLRRAGCPHLCPHPSPHPKEELCAPSGHPGDRRIVAGAGEGARGWGGSGELWPPPGMAAGQQRSCLPPRLAPAPAAPPRDAAAASGRDAARLDRVPHGSGAPTLIPSPFPGPTAPAGVKRAARFYFKPPPNPPNIAPAPTRSGQRVRGAVQGLSAPAAGSAPPRRAGAVSNLARPRARCENSEVLLLAAHGGWGRRRRGGSGSRGWFSGHPSAGVSSRGRRRRRWWGGGPGCPPCPGPCRRPRTAPGSRSGCGCPRSPRTRRASSARAPRRTTWASRSGTAPRPAPPGRRLQGRM